MPFGRFTSLHRNESNILIDLLLFLPCHLRSGIKKEKEKCISYVVTFISKLKEGSVLNLYVNIAKAHIIEQEIQKVSL